MVDPHGHVVRLWDQGTMRDAPDAPDARSPAESPTD
jgi:hypothetical protein